MRGSLPEGPVMHFPWASPWIKSSANPRSGDRWLPHAEPHWALAMLCQATSGNLHSEWAAHPRSVGEQGAGVLHCCGDSAMQALSCLSRKQQSTWKVYQDLFRLQLFSTVLHHAYNWINKINTPMSESSCAAFFWIEFNWISFLRNSTQKTYYMHFLLWKTIQVWCQFRLLLYTALKMWTA